MRAALLALLAATGCYAPTIADGQYSCSDGRCPEGFECTRVCRRCVKSGGNLDDAAECAGRDLAGNADGGLDPGCTNNGGQRASGDPGLPNVAFCPAAWSVPGVRSPASMTPMCGRMPLPDGAGCSVADNCALGWRVCNGDADVASRGLLSCEPAPPGMWVTRQPGAGNFTCSQFGSNNVIGCGDLGSPVTGCVVLDNGMTMNHCGNTGGVWSCPGVVEADSVVKSALALGGVICCRE